MEFLLEIQECLGDRGNWVNLIYHLTLRKREGPVTEAIRFETFAFLQVLHVFCIFLQTLQFFAISTFS